ncbi:MAG: hypothetical protein HY791_12675 [Deltaproteobacteria bacterium]|nr:hypothetical protein [Deltaproteobacteria bacterium]
MLARPVSLARASLIATALLASACKQREENERARQLIWGRDIPPTELEKKSKEKIDTNELDRSDAVARRVLDMSFGEIVGRLGFVEYRGVAELNIGVEPRKLGFSEETLIEHGLHGSMHVLQLGRNKTPLREMYYSGGVIFVSNEGGKLRAQGIAAIDLQHVKMREEVFEPLRTFTAFFGKRLALIREGEANASGRAAVKYSFALRKGDELVAYGHDTPKRPKKLSGTLLVDEATGAPLEAKLQGELEVPNPKKPDATPGLITLSLNFTIKVVEGRELTPKEYIPAIERHPTDLEPLAFLEGRTRTATVIGGPRPAPAAPEEEDEPLLGAPDAGIAPEEPTAPPPPPPAKAAKSSTKKPKKPKGER